MLTIMVHHQGFFFFKKKTWTAQLIVCILLNNKNGLSRDGQDHGVQREMLQAPSYILIYLTKRRCRYGMLISHNCWTKGWADCRQVALPLAPGVTRTLGDGELGHYPQLFQSYMTLLVCQRADCICGKRRARGWGRLERARRIWYLQ